MKTSLELGPTPCAEECEQLGPNYDPIKSRMESRAFIAQLTRTFGEPPTGAYFKIASCPHDFGTYHEVAIVYEEENIAASEYAWNVESNLPESWDEAAKALVDSYAKDGAA